LDAFVNSFLKNYKIFFDLSAPPPSLYIPVPTSFSKLQDMTHLFVILDSSPQYSGYVHESSGKICRMCANYHLKFTGKYDIIKTSFLFRQNTIYTVFGQDKQHNI